MTIKDIHMHRVSIVYFSQAGTTALLAEAIGRGARADENVDVALLRIRPESIHEGRWQDDDTLHALADSDTIVFGAPTYMGGGAAQFKAFADATAHVWYQRQWKHKLAAGFTISGSPSGDKLHTLSYLNALAAQHGMVWLKWDELPRQADGTNRIGSFSGLMAQNPAPPGMPPALDPADELSAENFGRYISSSTRRLSRVVA
ncbi:TPA: flavodoxin family protein [Pseudomonas aeruginosa]